MDAAIETPAQAVDQPLHVEPVHLRAEAGEDHFGFGRGVMVAAGEPEDVRRCGDENAAAIGENAGRPRKMIGEDLCLVVMPVAAAVGQELDAAQVPLAQVGIAAHLDDEEPAILVEAYAHRALDQRLRRHQLDVQPRVYLEAPQRLGRRQPRHPRQLNRLRLGCGAEGNGNEDHR